MVDTLPTVEKVTRLLVRLRGVLLPAAAVGLILIIFVPLPPILLDVLLAANIALSAVILLTTIHVASPLEFSMFPSVLLCATLLRLVVNVGATRLILTAGADGRGIDEAQLAAGGVIWAFGELIPSGSLAAGVVLLAIITIIQFVVVTRGAGRISEVAARFVLDAMPGKQMAIDADLNGGLISEDEARRRRQGIAAEADFYGAMDGASKFLRGDAVAAIVITIVNILGGLYVGTVQYGWSWSDTVALFARLTIGGGLAMQAPALIVSISAALLVTRSAAKTNFGEEFVRQLTRRPAVLAITAALLAALCLTRLPKLPLLALGAACAGLAWVLSQRQRQSLTDQAPDQPEPPRQAENVEDLLAVDPMRIELGYALVRLVEPAMGGDLLDRIAAIRRQMACELGLVVPPIRIRDDLNLESHAYVIRIRGGKVGGGVLYPRQFLAVGGDGGEGKLLGRQAVEPAFQTPAVWITPDQRERAEAMGYTVVEPVTVLVTHLTEVIRRHAADVLSREQVVRLLEKLKSGAGNLVKEASEKLRIGQIQRVLQNLLRERVPIRDLETILEAATEWADRTEDVRQITEHVRSALARELCQQHAGQDGKLRCVCIGSELERAISDELDRAGPGAPGIGSELSRKACRAVTGALAALHREGRRPVVLCAPQIRLAVRQLVAPVAPDATVLGYNEIESVEVETIASVGIEP